MRGGPRLSSVPPSLTGEQHPCPLLSVFSHHLADPAGRCPLAADPARERVDPADPVEERMDLTGRNHGEKMDLGSGEADPAQERWVR